MKRKDLYIIFIIALVIGVFPWLTGRNEYFISLLVFMGINGMITLGLSLLMGYAGQISLGHAAFFGLGAYISGIFTTRFGLDPWFALVIAAAASGLLAFIIGFPILKLKGHYLAMATLGFGLIIYRIVLGGRIFGQAEGISNVPHFWLFAGLEINGRATFRVMNY